jgi:hypothetical protein
MPSGNLVFNDSNDDDEDDDDGELFQPSGKSFRAFSRKRVSVM